MQSRRDAAISSCEESQRPGARAEHCTWGERRQPVSGSTGGRQSPFSQARAVLGHVRSHDEDWARQSCWVPDGVWLRERGARGHACWEGPSGSRMRDGRRDSTGGAQVTNVKRSGWREKGMRTGGGSRGEWGTVHKGKAAHRGWGKEAAERPCFTELYDLPPSSSIIYPLLPDGSLLRGNNGGTRKTARIEEGLVAGSTVNWGESIRTTSQWNQGLDVEYTVLLTKWKIVNSGKGKEKRGREIMDFRNMQRK